MSELYIKWRNTENNADRIISYAERLRNCSERVKEISNNLQMSSDISSVIKRNLTNEADKITNLSVNMYEIGNVLNDISEIYKTTEKSLN